MLGLGNNLIHSNKVRNRIINYISDFTSDNDNWVKNPITIPQSLHIGTPTVTANQSIDGTDGWLKVVYAANQTYGGIFQRDLFPPPQKYRVSDTVIASLKIYLYHDGSTDHWEGTDDVQVKFSSGYGNGPESQVSIPLNTSTTISFEDDITSFAPHNYYTDLHITFNSASDTPQAGAIFYIKDCTVEVWR